MLLSIKTAFIIVGLAIASCSASPPPQATQPPQTPQPAPAPTTAQQPTNPQIRQVTVLEGLEHPWGLAWLPDGAMLITERPGRLRIVRDGKLDPNPITGVPEVFAMGQGGLLDVAVHPQFAENRLIYLTYAHGTREANRTRIARAEFDGQALQNLEVIFEVSPSKPGTQHFGSRLLWLPDQTLLVTIGDGGNPPLQLNGDLIRKQAQNLNTALGKIIRIKDDGTIPADNPFVNQSNANPAVWSYGHRNIQGITLNPSSNQIWVSEHGARGGDELNLVEAGKNYGWPVVSESREYSTGQPVSEVESQPGMVGPKLVWDGTLAPSGLTFYTGDRLPQWQGHLFAGGLISRELRRLELDSAGTVVNQETIDMGQRVRDVRQSPDGFLYVLTDEANGQLIRFEPEI